MKCKLGYKGYVIVARSCELKDGRFAAEFSVEEHAADGVEEMEFFLPDSFPTHESAIEAGLQAGRHLRERPEAGYRKFRTVLLVRLLFYLGWLQSNPTKAIPEYAR